MLLIGMSDIVISPPRISADKENKKRISENITIREKILEISPEFSHHAKELIPQISCYY